MTEPSHKARDDKKDCDREVVRSFSCCGPPEEHRAPLAQRRLVRPRSRNYQQQDQQAPAANDENAQKPGHADIHIWHLVDRTATLWADS